MLHKDTMLISADVKCPITDQTAHYVQSDLDQHCPQKLLVSSSIWKELKAFESNTTFLNG